MSEIIIYSICIIGWLIIFKLGGSGIRWIFAGIPIAMISEYLYTGMFLAVFGFCASIGIIIIAGEVGDPCPWLRIFVICLGLFLAFAAFCKIFGFVT